MPVTASGTPYTVYSADLGVHGMCYWGVADAHVGDADLTTILYAHGAGGAADQFASLSAWQGMRDQVIDRGWAWIEGRGGTDSQSWANASARAAYPAYLAHVEGILSVGELFLLGRSMGGLITAWLYAMSSLASRFAGWINNSGVSTLFTGTESGSKNTDAASSYYFSPAVWTAWGATDMATMHTAADAYAPEDWDASVWGGKNILCCYGDADTTVPWSTRGAETLRVKWAGLPAIDQVAVLPGGGHSPPNASYSQVTPMVEFILEVLGETPEPPVPKTVYRRLSSWLMQDGDRYQLTRQ